MSGASSWERPRTLRVLCGVGNRVLMSPSSSVRENTIGGCVSRSTPIFLWCCEPVWERGGGGRTVSRPFAGTVDVALSTCRKVLLLTSLPAMRTPAMDFTRKRERWSGWKWCIGGVRVSTSRRRTPRCACGFKARGDERQATTASVTTWGAMSNEILALREHLVAEKVTCVVMESTGDYWKPFYYLLEDA